MSQELFAAAQSGDAAQIKKLLEAGADHAAADEAGETALMHAAHGGHVAAVQVLIAAGADVNAQSPQGSTALAKAAYNGETERGYVEVIDVLSDAGASLDARIFFGITPLMLARLGGEDRVRPRPAGAGVPSRRVDAAPLLAGYVATFFGYWFGAARSGGQTTKQPFGVGN